MPGFGLGPFGSNAFGEWGWASRTLYGTLPQLYRTADTTGQLRSWTEGVGDLLDVERHRVQTFGSLRDPLEARSQYDETSELVLDRVIQKVSEPEQRGINAVITSGRTFYDSVARFTAVDVGKILILSGSTQPQNNVQVVIASIVSPNEAVTDPALFVDAGPLNWELRSVDGLSDDSIEVAVRTGDVSAIARGWTLFDGSSEFEVIGRKQFDHTNSETRQVLVDAFGSDGYVDSVGRLRSDSYVFSPSDVGKTLVLTGSTIQSNTGLFQIAAVQIVAVGDVRLVCSPALSEDVGPIGWAIRSLPVLTLKHRSLPKGVVEQEGTDLVVISVAGPLATVFSTRARFTVADIGKELSFQETAGALLFKTGVVTTLLDANTVKLTVSTTVSASPAFWQLRSSTGLSVFGGPIGVNCFAQSMLAMLAQDFGIVLDDLETEQEQRSWVKNVTRWLDLKGTQKSYEIMGQISGFGVSVAHLYRVSIDVASLLGLHLVEVPDAGRSGTDGSIGIGVDGRGYLSSPTGSFVVSDVGKAIRVTGAAQVLNNKLFQIETLVSSTRVAFRVVDTVTLPEANNGSLSWVVERLYSDVPPLMPRYDDVNSDRMTEVLGVPNWSVDRFCWDPSLITYVSADITAVSPSTVQPYPVMITVTVSGPADVIASVGQWLIEDSTAVRYPIETMPVDIGGGSFTFQVNATRPPALLGAKIRYICPEQLSCMYCGSYRVKVVLTAPPALVAQGMPAVLKVYDRIVARMVDVTPAHVELIFTLVT